MSKDNYTRRIVESPLFERVSGLHFDDADGDGYSNQTVIIPSQRGLSTAFMLGSYAETGNMDAKDWVERGPLDYNTPATQALLIYMLSKYCAWAKLDGETVWIGYEVYGLPHPLTHSFQAPTLAETFAQAFAFVEGL